MSGNSPWCYQAYWAAVRSGFYITAINFNRSPEEAAYIVNDGGAKAFLVAVDLGPLAPAPTPQTRTSPRGWPRAGRCPVARNTRSTSRQHRLEHQLRAWYQPVAG